MTTTIQAIRRRAALGVLTASLAAVLLAGCATPAGGDRTIPLYYVTAACAYEHRLTGIPGTRGGSFTGQVLVSSREPNATVTIRAYQKTDNGYHPIDVFDSEGKAVGSVTSLAPAQSIKRFQFEGVRGWHTVIIEHPTARAMRNASVAMRLSGPADVGVQIIPVQGSVRCL